MSPRAIAVWVGCGAVFFGGACGEMISSDLDASPNEAGIDATASDGLADVAGDTSALLDASDGNTRPWNDCIVDGGAQPLNLGYACQQDSDCCSLHCSHGSCQRPVCASDYGPCTHDSECCSGSCYDHVECAPAAYASFCQPLGQACGKNSECCSMVCLEGVCAQGSFCGQYGDVCVKATDCCGGVCDWTHSAGAFGRCLALNTQSVCGAQFEGIACGVSFDGGALCGGGCCSHACAPWGPLQNPICQPPSGCRPVGDLCNEDSDCCGGGGIQVCNRLSTPDAGPGVCSNPTGCKPNGDVCNLTGSCNATAKCCAGSISDACRQDNAGVPRCSHSIDGGSCVPASASCSSSADCCDGPCVPADGGFACWASACVSAPGPCTRDADCCVGAMCYIAGGELTGTCRARTDGTCALYGQSCTNSSECCGATPCTGGRCEYAWPL